MEVQGGKVDKALMVDRNDIGNLAEVMLIPVKVELSIARHWWTQYH